MSCMQPPHEFQIASSHNNVSSSGDPQASSVSQDTTSDWQEFTAGDGRRYYYNKRTKQSSWEKPLELMTPLERADASTVWKEFTTAEGKKYYYNKDTKQSKWTMPVELKLARELAEKEASRETQSPATLTTSTYGQPSASVSSANDVSSSTTTKMSKKDARCLATTFIGSKKVRGKTQNVKLRKLWEKNGKRALPIEFDKFDQNTYRPVGDNADDFTTLVGTLVRDIPKRYDSWDKVPEEHKIAIWPTIETFFDMRTHLKARFSNKVKLGVSALCAERYRDQKWKFKGQWFTKRAYEHPEQIRQEPPPNMDPVEWNKYVDYYLQEGVVKRSQSNAANRAQQKFPSLHGRKAYAQYRHQNRDPETLQYPSLIDQYAHMHMKNGVFVDPLLEENHRQMEQLRNAQSGSPNPMSEADILGIVLGERRGHNRGRGRKLPGSSSDLGSGSHSQGVGRVYTQAEVDAMFAAQMATQHLQMQAIFDALRRSGISVNVPHPTNLGNTEDEESDSE